MLGPYLQNSDGDDNDNDMLNNQDPFTVQQDISNVVLAPAGVPDNEAEFNCLEDVVNNEDDDVDFIASATFKETDNCSMKIVSFPN